MARPVGSVNKVTRTIREAIIESFDAIGGAAWLRRIAEDDPKTYAMLLAKAMPTQVEGSNGGPVQIQILTAVPAPEPTTDV